ncbi:hypothetical protein CH333_04510 [candidate division WOR-3 bacterium JGI_Cruoil_03_44_89]|uniref:Glycosyl transferase family 1 domain-containing protein n=1 Tax=candidate division WOR-3 bacterium JGI_Cruoil_03_44_89 TaxID=1973748 RepID=A0A235BUM6_UNCW3|nr:MAG: hypothetical protein CH333_04510 [candidate division WOR-3 bacterium JGI_Cruoil_03_44_89]
MSLWNAANGPSIHAELIGREWVKTGHRLTVFSSERHPDARPTLQKDEDFIIRHFAVDVIKPFTRATDFDPSPLLKKDYEVFVAQNLERLPAERLLRVFPEIKKKAATVCVAHEGKPPEDPLYYKFSWDALVCFDDRYKNFLLKYFSEELIHTIPYPYYPFTPGDKLGARKKLGLPPEEKIVFSFGFRPGDVTPVLPSLKHLSQRYGMRYIVVTNPESDVNLLKELESEYPFLDIQVRPLPFDELYMYLHASDVHLIYRESSKKYPAVLSSTVCQTLGSGCPILFHVSNYVERAGDEIIKYKDSSDLEEKLSLIFENGFDTSEIKKFLKTHDATRIANQFIELFEKFFS